MASYASTTKTTSASSRAEIERILTRYGADNFGYMTSHSGAAVAFTANDRQVRFAVELPDRNAREFTHTPARHEPRTATAAEAAYEQAVRQRWRALVLIVKAKLEAVASGIVEFEQEFLPYMVLPDGSTVYEATREAIATQYATGRPAALLQIEN